MIVYSLSCHLILAALSFFACIVLNVKGQSVDSLPLEWNFLQFYGTRKGQGTWIGSAKMVILSSADSQTWEFDYITTPSNEENGTWTQITSHEQPLPRSYAAITSLQVGNDVYAVMFGGKSTDLSKKAVSRNSLPGLFGDTWLYLNKKWTKVQYPKTGPLPIHRSKHSMSMISSTSSVLMFGGSSTTTQNQAISHLFLNDVWTFTYGVGWVNETGSAHKMPSKRINSAMAPIGEKLVLLFGGSNGLIGTEALMYDDTWIYNHSITNNDDRWQQLSTPKKPSKRMNHVMAGIKENIVVLYGGTDPTNQPLDDVWIYNGTDWFQFHTINKPEARSSPGLTHLRLKNGEERVILFGGFDTKNDLSDAYALNLNNGEWDDVTYYVSPSPRSRHASAGKYLFGGQSTSSTTNNQEILSDTWMCSYTTTCRIKPCWTKLKQSAQTPPPLYNHAMSTFSSGVVLFGGSGKHGVNYNDKIWALDEKQQIWRPVNPVSSSNPSGRIYHQMAELGLEGNMMLMFGGNTDSSHGSVCGTWLLRLTRVVAIGIEADQWAWINIIPDNDKKVGDGVHPEARGGHSMTTLNTQNVLMFGGCNVDISNNVCTPGTFFPDTWLYSETDQWKSVPIAGREGYDKPFGRVHAALSNFGGQNRGILFGGQRPINQSLAGYFGSDSNMFLLEDTWMFTYDDDSGYRWLRLGDNSNGLRWSIPHPRIHSNWLSVEKSLVLFGGEIQHDDGPVYEFKNAGDTWFLKEGCPPGTFFKNGIAEGCSDCKRGTYNDNADPVPACNRCPVGTTTKNTQCRRKSDCDSCNSTASLSFGTCQVKNYESIWTCLPGGYGPECSKSGCGGIQVSLAKLCSGQGSCSDGINGTGACECKSGIYGLFCDKQCPGYDEVTGIECGGQGKCNDGPNGNGECVCNFLYLGSPTCEVPILGLILFTSSLIIMTITMVIVLNLWRRKISRDTNNALRLRETQLEEGYRNALSNLEQGWIVEWADLKLTKLIARGSYGEVWKSKWAMLPQNIDVAVKKIMVTPTIMTQDVNVNGVSKKTKRPSNPIEKIFKDNEIKLLMRTRHRRVCLFLGAGRTDSGEIFMVHEYVPGGNLREVLDDLTIFLSMSRCINIARDIAEGMEFLHGRSLIHRDLKSLNVLIDEAGRAKIADFGISRFTSAKERKNRLKMRPTIAVVKNKELRMTFSKDEEEEKKGEEDLRAVPAETKTSGTFSSQRTSSETKPGRQKRRSSNRGESAEMTGNRGSILWMAPEILSQTGETAVYGYVADVYSFGIVLFEIVTKRLPWAKVKAPLSSNIWSKVKEGLRPELETEKEKQHLLVPLMEVCWSQSPDDRPTFKECKEFCDQLLEIVGRKKDETERYSRPSFQLPKNTRDIEMSRSFRDSGSFLEEISQTNPLMSQKQVNARKTTANVSIMSDSEVALRKDSMGKKKSRSLNFFL